MRASTSTNFFFFFKCAPASSWQFGVHFTVVNDAPSHSKLNRDKEVPCNCQREKRILWDEMLTWEVEMVCHSRKLALWGSLPSSEWTVVCYPSKRVSMKLERSFEKGRERGVEREEESSFFCVWVIRNLTNVEKCFVWMWVFMAVSSWHSIAFIID